MKNKLGLLALFMSVGVLLLLTNCQKDDEVTTTTQSSNATSGIKVSTISFDEFKRDTKAYDEFLNVSKDNIAKRMVVDSDNGFFYNDSEVILIEYGKNKTYTFEIFTKTIKADVYENLVIFKDEIGKTTSHRFEYNLDAADLLNLSTGKQIVDLSQKYQIKTVGGDEESHIFHADDGNCYTYSSSHIPDPDKVVYLNIGGNIVPCVRVECPPSLQLSEDGTGGGGGDSGGGDSGGGDSGGSSGGNGGGFSGGGASINITVVIPVGPDWDPVTDPGGSSGGGNGGGNYPEPVITLPSVILDYHVYRTLFLNNSPIYDWVVANPEFKEELDKFLIAPGLSFQDKQDFAKDLLDFAYINENNKELARQLLEFLEEEEYSPESLELAGNIIIAIEEYYDLFQNPDEELLSDFVDSVLNPGIEEGEEEELVLPPSCDSFNFVPTGSNWQESAVANVHFNVNIITPQGTYSYVVDYPQPILFGCPLNLLVGNTQISSGIAANLSARSLKLSMNETVKKYGNKAVTFTIIRIYFESRLKHNYPLFIPGARVNFNANNFTVVPTQYQTNAFGTGDCD